MINLRLNLLKLDFPIYNQLQKLMMSLKECQNRKNYKTNKMQTKILTNKLMIYRSNLAIKPRRESKKNNSRRKRKSSKKRETIVGTLNLPLSSKLRTTWGTPWQVSPETPAFRPLQGFKRLKSHNLQWNLRLSLPRVCSSSPRSIGQLAPSPLKNSLTRWALRKSKWGSTSLRRIFKTSKGLLRWHLDRLV